MNQLELRTNYCGGIASAAIAVAGGLLASEGSCLLQRGLEVQVLGDQLAGGTGTELHALDVLRHGELAGGGLASGVLDAEGEDGKVGNLHVLAFEQQLLDAADHVGEHAVDGSLGERGVVVRHVLGQTVQVDGLFDDRVGVVLAVAL